MAAAPTATGSGHVEIVYSELDFPAQKCLHAAFRFSLQEHGALADEQRHEQLSKALKEHCEKMSSGGWSAIVGSNFSAAFSFDSLMHHFVADQHAVLLFRSV